MEFYTFLRLNNKVLEYRSYCRVFNLTIELVKKPKKLQKMSARSRHVIKDEYYLCNILQPKAVSVEIKVD